MKIWCCGRIPVQCRYESWKEESLPFERFLREKYLEMKPYQPVSHCIFHQIEGLYIDKAVSFADLMQTLQYFASEFFGPNAKN